MEVKIGSIEERIINASFEILEKEGISKTTTKKIAQTANVSEVTLFRKFKNKETLINVTKDYYCKSLLEKLNQIFEFREDEKIDEYLINSFHELINLDSNELNMIKVGIREVIKTSKEETILLKISETIIKKLKDFFTIKIKRHEIRNINPEMLAMTIFSIIFEYTILIKVYGKPSQIDIDTYINDFLDITLNGIKVI